MTTHGVPMASLTAEDAVLDARERRYDAVVDRFIPYIGLAIGGGVTLFIQPVTLAYWAPTLLVMTVTAGWSWFFTTHPVGVREDGRPLVRADLSPRLAWVHVVVSAALTVLLVWRSPAFGFQSVAGYVHAFAFTTGRGRIVAVALAAIAPAWAQMGGGFTIQDLSPLYVAGWALLTIVNGALGGLFTYFGQLTSGQSARRRVVIEQLDATNRRLQETLEENAALHARLLAQAREAGILDERARLAREIHDTIAQGLAGVVTQLEAAGTADVDEPTAGTTAERRRHVEIARSLARESLTEARRSVEALSPGRLADARLPDAIADMAKLWAETADVAVHADTTGDAVPLVPDIEVTLFRVAQEALANVGKHARASRVGITLSYMDDVVVLDVVDDGAGFDPATVEPTAASGFGLPSMEQRVRRVSGTFTVESAPGEGTAISASVPAIPAQEGER